MWLVVRCLYLYVVWFIGRNWKFLSGGFIFWFGWDFYWFERGYNWFDLICVKIIRFGCIGKERIRVVYWFVVDRKFVNDYWEWIGSGECIKLL